MSCHILSCQYNIRRDPNEKNAELSKCHVIFCHVNMISARTLMKRMLNKQMSCYILSCQHNIRQDPSEKNAELTLIPTAF